MSFHFTPATRGKTPMVIGIAGPTKSGKTYSAHRLAQGLANGGPIAMINTEGPKGHQYADKFSYMAGDLTPPYRPARYQEAFKAALALNPGVVIIDSLTHLHDGPGGMLDYHETELDRLAGQDYKKRQRSTWSAWIKPKAEENALIYAMLDAGCHLIWCFRAKEKLKIVKGKDPIELGLQPIASDRISFETLFTLVLPAHSRGVPDLAVSQMRDPFDSMIKPGQPLTEETGRLLGEWARGGTAKGSAGDGGETPAPRGRALKGAQPAPADAPVISKDQVGRLWTIASGRQVPEDAMRAIVSEVGGVDSTKLIPVAKYDAVIAAVEAWEPSQSQFPIPAGAA